MMLLPFAHDDVPTFSLISISGDIAQSVGCHEKEGGIPPPPQSEVESILVEMIEEGIIFAMIDRATQMVSFRENPMGFVGHDSLEQMTERMKEMVRIADRVRNIDAIVTTSKSYVKAQVSADKLREDMATATASAEAAAARSDV